MSLQQEPHPENLLYKNLASPFFRKVCSCLRGSTISHYEDFEIKLQIVCYGKSSRLRRKALREPELKLQDMIIEGRKSQVASGMETKSTEESHKFTWLERHQNMLQLWVSISSF